MFPIKFKTESKDPQLFPSLRKGIFSPNTRQKTLAVRSVKSNTKSKKDAFKSEKKELTPAAAKIIESFQIKKRKEVLPSISRSIG